ncbi:MAG: TIGR00159 family protein [Firmicutes bacterium]|nr:TIGR00159 family protein [Bacillota bacterium]
MRFTVRDAVDILVVAFVIYRVIDALRGTRAITLVKGLAVIFASSVVARALNLRTISWLLNHATTAVIVALPVVFYPELRRTLEEIGRGQFLARWRSGGASPHAEVSEVVARAAAALSGQRIGALIVLQRRTGLKEYIDSGIALDSLVSEELLRNIFEPNSPLHDGAVIIHGNRILSARCVLPLTSADLGSAVGTRHRAAVGLSEQSDAVVVVVSEETGIISLAVGGRLQRYFNEIRLRERLEYHLQSDAARRFTFGGEV